MHKQKSGYKNFLVTATVGYTATGTFDSVEDIAEVLSKNKSINCYLHVDAAFAGFILPFTGNKQPFDFKINKIQSLAVDPHKMGLVPYPTGVFLCRKNLQKLISQRVDYTQSLDDTLTSSRCGVSSAACWAAFNFLGKEGYHKKLAYCLKLKNYFLEKVAGMAYQVKIIHEPCMNIAAISFSKKLPPLLEQKYRLIPIELPLFEGTKTISKEWFYKFYFMSHLTKKMLNMVIQDIVNSM